MSTYIFKKNGSLERPKNVSRSDFMSASYGTEYQYSPIDNPLTKFLFSGSYSGDDYKKIYSLKNTINHYKGYDDIFNFDNFSNTPVSLLCISSNHLGSGIKKSSIELNFYQSGSLVDRALDKYENGVLYNKNDEKVGIALYKEGFILLNHTGSITNNKSYFNNYYDNPRWIYYLISTSDDISFEKKYTISNEIPSYTIFCEAKKYSLNHSNNMTFIKNIYEEVPIPPTPPTPSEFIYSLNFSFNRNTFYIAGI